MAILNSPKMWLGGILLGIITELLWKTRLNDDDNSIMALKDDTPGLPLNDDQSVMVLNDDETALVLNHDVVWEILVRLPTPTLIRFKCVSKHWNSIIRDPLFAKAYIGCCYHGLLISEGPFSYRLDEVKGITERFYASCFNGNNGYNDRKKIIQAYSYPVAIDRKFITNGNLYSTNVVKGLFGLYNNRGKFKLCNITTHELLDLPITTLRQIDESSGLSIKCEYYLAFEPVREVYKLLRFCYIGTFGDPYLQICTLGRGEGGRGGGNDIDWRSLGQVPHLAHTDSMQKTCINEILYLMDGCKYMDWNRSLVVFDLSTETISETTRLPESVASFVETIELVRLGGRPALISLASQLGKIWILDANGSWTEIISVAFIGKFDLTSAGNLPTGELVLAQRTKRKGDPLPIYKYDHIQNKLMKLIEVDVCFRNIEPDMHFWKICYYEHNILPLDCFGRRR